jgi:hypothetical protein
MIPLLGFPLVVRVLHGRLAFEALKKAFDERVLRFHRVDDVEEEVWAHGDLLTCRNAIQEIRA